jgi:hypothetical protein
MRDSGLGWVALLLSLMCAGGMIYGLIGVATGRIRTVPPPGVHAKTVVGHRARPGESRSRRVSPRRSMPSPGGGAADPVP